jgi:transposase InsO family protein
MIAIDRDSLARLGGVKLLQQLGVIYWRLIGAQRWAGEQQRGQHGQNNGVHGRDALWALDQTLLARDVQGELHSLAVRDCYKPRALGLSLGPSATGEDVVNLLEKTAAARKTWPLAIQFDNGPENKNATVQECLKRHRVIAIWNEPYTPQHNPRAERGFGDLKLASGLEGPALRLADPSQAPVCPLEPGVPRTRADVALRLIDAWVTLDAHTPRASLGGRTPLEVDRIAPRAEDLTNRARFYAEVCEERQRAACAQLDARARRKAEREAAWQALQRHGLVTRTRGGCLVPTDKPEGIS